jgi:hypothetical protein
VALAGAMVEYASAPGVMSHKFLYYWMRCAHTVGPNRAVIRFPAVQLWSRVESAVTALTDPR